MTNKRIIAKMMEECLEEIGRKERQINVVDAQIDKRVYELYGLTEEARELVEKSL